MEAASTAASVAGMGLNIAGGILGAAEQLRQAKDEAGDLRYQAEQIKENTIDRIIDLNRERDAIRGSQRIAFGSGGVKVNAGSPLLLEAETNYRASVQRTRLERAGFAQVYSLHRNADRIERGGRVAMTGTLLKTFANTLETGVSFLKPTPAGGTV